MENQILKLPIKEIVFASIICIVLAACDTLCFPTSLFINITVSDITPVYFALMINQWFWIILGVIAIRFLCPNLNIYIKLKFFKNGWGKFWLSIVIMVCISALTFSLGLIGKYNYSPSVEKIIVEGFIYYISVAIIEELYIRALLLNIIERIAYKSKYATLIAIVVSSTLFGMGHIIGMIGQDILTIICRVIWTISLGIYLGVIYKRSNNLWLPIVAHAIIDFCSVSYCFISTPIFPVATVIIIAVSYLIIAMFLLYKHYIKSSLRTEKQNSI